MESDLFLPEGFHLHYCPTEIVGFNKLAKDFEDRDAVLLGGSTDNEFVKLAWRREHPDLNKLGHYQFGDTTGALIDQLGVRERVPASRCAPLSSSTPTTRSSTFR